MIILDAYAVLAFLQSEPAGPQVRELMLGDEELALTLLGIAEVLDRLVRRAGIDEDEAWLDVVQLGLAASPALDPQLAMRAGLLRARHYDRRTRAISLADCVAAETARRLDASLATADPPLLDTCDEEGIAVIVLPDSNGAVWPRSWLTEEQHPTVGGPAGNAGGDARPAFLVTEPVMRSEGETADEYSGTLEDGRRAMIVLSRGREPCTVITVMLARGELGWPTRELA